jgi:hypothetical protein
VRSHYSFHLQIQTYWHVKLNSFKIMWSLDVLRKDSYLLQSNLVGFETLGELRSQGISYFIDMQETVSFTFAQIVRPQPKGCWYSCLIPFQVEQLFTNLG